MKQIAIICLVLVLIIVIVQTFFQSKEEDFEDEQYVDPNAINPGWGNQLGQLEGSRVPDPLDPRLWKAIEQRVSQYPGGFADVVMTLQDRNEIPSIKNITT